MEEKSFKVELESELFQAHYIKTLSNAEFAISKLIEKDCLFGIDTETEPYEQFKDNKEAGLSPWLSKVRLLQVSDGESICVFDLKYLPTEIFIPFLEAKRFIAHNAVFDLQYFMMWGVKDMNIACTLILYKLMCHANYPTDAGWQFSLSALAESILKTTVLKKMQVSDWSEPELTFEQIEYAALDPLICLKLAERVAHGVKQFGLERIYKLYKDSQHPIAQMQINGIGFDKEKHRLDIVYWREKLFTAKKELTVLTGLENITAHTMAEWLEGNLDKETLAIWPRTETGKLQTDSHAFSEFSYLPIVKPFSAYQKRKTLTSTFGQNLIDLVNPRTKRLHSSFKLCGARTGRLSSSYPNFQNFPRSPTAEEKEGGEPDLRDNFTARGSFICADYNQIELRVAAELSQDKEMLRAYSEGIDLHALTASKIMGKSLTDVTKSDRQLAKAFNFGLLFGLGPLKFSAYARKSYGQEVSKNEAVEAIQIFRETYYGYREWQLEQAEEASKNLTATTVCGKLRALAEDTYYGQSLNSPIQGSAAEVVLHALTRLHQKSKAFNFKLVNCVHDEILLEVNDSLGTMIEVETILKKCMIQGFLDVFPNGITKGLVKSNTGSTWAEAK